VPEVFTRQQSRAQDSGIIAQGGTDDFDLTLGGGFAGRVALGDCSHKQQVKNVEAGGEEATNVEIPDRPKAVESQPPQPHPTALPQ